jgi:hypothetical protein
MAHQDDHEHTGPGRRVQDEMPDPSERPEGRQGRDDDDREGRFESGGERLQRAQGAPGDVEPER